MHSPAILILNSGSSSIKFAVFASQAMEEGPKRLLGGQIAGIGAAPLFDAKDNQDIPIALGEDHALALSQTSDHAGALSVLLDWLQGERLGLSIAAAGHRVVHGGGNFTKPVRLNPAIIDQLRELIPLAPHHQPHNIAAMEALAKRLPRVQQVACFDTAFHSDQPPVARQLGLPASYGEKGIRRYGFHGLSYDHVVSALPRIAAAPLPERLVIAHLGNGASLCAVQNGKGVATTMGFSTLDGLPMGTRSGSLDPGALLYLMRQDGLDLEALEDLLYNRSGLLGISGISADMRVLLDSGQPSAKDAIDFYCYRIVREVGSLAAALGGMDALVFTGGIGENAATARANVINRLAWLGLSLDEKANESNASRITGSDGTCPAWIVPADEESVIARHTVNVLGGI